MKANMRSTWWLAALASVLVTAGLLGASASVASADATACGTKDNPCPLQKWMRANMGTAAAAEDTAALGKALEKTATLSPDATWTWAKIATDGAASAKKGDLAVAKASCKTCHDAYKDKYKAQYRTKAVN